VVHDDPLLLSSLLFESTRLKQARPHKVELIDTVEFALAHSLVAKRQVKPDQDTAVIVFAQTFTKVFFMRGAFIETILPTIHEGSDSDKVCDTAFSKLLFELDSGRFSNLRQVVVAGDVERTQAQKLFKEKLPDIPVTRLDFDDLALGYHAEALTGRTCPYAVPIALALKALDGRAETPLYQ